MHAYQHDASAICLSGQYQASTGPIQPSEARHRPARGQYSHQRLDEGQHGAEYARGSSSGLPILCTRAKHRRLTSLRQRTSCSQSHTKHFPPRAPRPSLPELRNEGKEKRSASMLTRLDGLIQTLDALRSRIGDHDGSLSLHCLKSLHQGQCAAVCLLGPVVLEGSA